MYVGRETQRTLFYFILKVIIYNIQLIRWTSVHVSVLNVALSLNSIQSCESKATSVL